MIILYTSPFFIFVDSGIPEISPYAKQLKREGNVYSRLYQDSVRRNSPKKEEEEKNNFNPEISPIAKNIKREGKVHDRLYKKHSDKMEKKNDEKN